MQPSSLQNLGHTETPCDWRTDQALVLCWLLGLPPCPLATDFLTLTRPCRASSFFACFLLLLLVCWLLAFAAAFLVLLSVSCFRLLVFPVFLLLVSRFLFPGFVPFAFRPSCSSFWLLPLTFCFFLLAFRTQDSNNRLFLHLLLVMSSLTRSPCRRLGSAELFTSEAFAKTGAPPRTDKQSKHGCKWKINDYILPQQTR